MEQNIKYIWVDYIRVLATFCVIILHSTAPLLYSYNNLPEPYWMTANIFNSSVRMCVPLFFMLSGFLLLEKDEPLSIFFKKRFTKVIFPLLIWSTFYIFWKAYFEKSAEISIHSFYSLIISPAYYHLWFLYAITGIYLTLPFLRVIAKQSENRLLYYYVSIWFLAVAIIPLIVKTIRLGSEIDLFAISGFSGYLILGLILGRLSVTKKIAFTAGIIALASVFVTVIGTHVLTVRNGGIFAGYFYEYRSPNVIILAAAIFVLIKYTVCNVSVLSSSRVLSIVRSLSSASLGIYLIHIIFINLLPTGKLGFVISAFQGHPIFSVPLLAATTYLLSYSTIACLKQIPLVKKIVP